MYKPNEIERDLCYHVLCDEAVNELIDKVNAFLKLGEGWAVVGPMIVGVYKDSDYLDGETIVFYQTIAKEGYI